MTGLDQFKHFILQSLDPFLEELTLCVIEQVGPRISPDQERDTFQLVVQCLKVRLQSLENIPVTQSEAGGQAAYSKSDDGSYFYIFTNGDL